MRRVAVPVLLCVALLGCASTKVDTAGAALQEPLCRADGAKLPLLVYWGAKWRADQKEPALREAAALRGIEEFFASSPCVAATDIRRLPGERFAAVPPDAELLAATANADKVLVIVVRELGPVLRLGLPALVEGGTEVVLEVRMLDARTARPLADVRTHWQNGGAFVVKGVKSLDADMSAALSAVLAAHNPKPGGASR